MGAEYQLAPGAALPGLRCKRRTEARAMLVTLRPFISSRSTQTPTMTPSQIVNYLYQHVVGQEEAKRQLAVAIYTHYRKIALAELDKV